MKKISALLVVLMFVSLGAFAQVILYQENFSGTGVPSGVFMVPATSWAVASITPSNLPQSSKGQYLQTVAGRSGEKNAYINISTLGFSKATITWEQYRNPHNINSGNTAFHLTEPVELQYSVNGGLTRITFYTSTNNVNGAWNKVNGGKAIELPAAAMGMPNVRIYWRITYNAENRRDAYYAIDDIMITGTPETGLATFDWATRPLNEDPFVVSGLNAVSPYKVDDVTLRWSRTLDRNVVLETAKVDDKTFRPGTRSLTFVQTGATTAAGSVIQLDLNKPIEDLTFTIFDVDVTKDQFIDELTIVGYNNGTRVPMTKSKVKTTSNASFSATASSLTGLNIVDNASNEGDATISFAGAVTRVTIVYRNTSAIRNSSGRQGFAIQNLSWRKEEQIIPLPVELVSFKATNQHGAARLTWTTASEKDNDRFEIERSQDGKSFAKVGEVAGNGTSSTALNYSFTDARPATGTNYYRLRQVDYDGTYTYSKTAVVTFAARKAGEPIAQVFPTMATDKVTVALQATVQSAEVMVMDASGKAVAQYSRVTDTELVLPVQNLKAGMYFVTVSDGEARHTYRFLKQ
ncbi:T9SS type A sorting domain-containing protein [Pontibacter burrus]|uniref:T9SS type A sorting domain-containing protein n=1 Tax=Pontibacter burrus TaxID=2704466 RepID=A0A6B3LHG6_9BACT|nr:T9SS type A sorting domain-containing protein [Pontibacter burrus]NEM96452.1 T9SS type A sorting domain-containing protein [Pontibacter burrus]